MMYKYTVKKSDGLHVTNICAYDNMVAASGVARIMNFYEHASINQKSTYYIVTEEWK